jgi:hypothetical protein
MMLCEWDQGCVRPACFLVTHVGSHGAHGAFGCADHIQTFVELWLLDADDPRASITIERLAVHRSITDIPVKEGLL